MTLDKLKLHLKIYYFYKEFKQILLVYSFAIGALFVLGYVGYSSFSDTFPTIQTQLLPKNNSENLYVYLVIIGVFLLLIFYIFYALFFYPKKFKKDITRINYFIEALKKGEKIIDYQIISAVENENKIGIFESLFPMEYMWFELTDKSFSQEGSEEYFLVPNYCKKEILAYYDSYGNGGNVEDTWNELK